MTVPPISLPPLTGHAGDSWHFQGQSRLKGVREQGMACQDPGWESSRTHHCGGKNQTCEEPPLDLQSSPKTLGIPSSCSVLPWDS